jgi:membrane protein
VDRLRSSRAGQLGLGVYGRWKRDTINDIAAAITYWTVLSIPPAALAMAALLGWLELIIGEETANDVRQTVIEFIEGSDFNAGGNIAKTVVDLLTTPRGGIAVVGFLIAVWSMSKGFAGLFRGLARIHGEPEARNNMKGRLLALAFGLATVAVIIVLLLSIVLGPLLGFEELLPNKGGIFIDIWNWVRWPVLAVGIVAWIALLQSVGPGIGLRFRQAVPGAAMTAVGWVVITLGFQLYLDLSGGANPLFRSLGGIIVALTWLYLVMVALLLGGALNAVRLEERSPDLVTVA